MFVLLLEQKVNSRS